VQISEEGPHFPQGLPFLLNCRDWHVRYYPQDQIPAALDMDGAAPDVLLCETPSWIEPMARNGLKLGLAAVLVLVTGAAASAQGLGDMQLFALADQSRYGGGYCPNEGYFFVFDGLVWNISSPETTSIGFQDLTRLVWYDETTSVIQSNELDTGFMKTDFTNGQRYEFGHISGHHGWVFTGFTLSDQNQRLVSSDADVVFSDPPFGPGGTQRLEGYIDALLTVIDDLPVTFTEIEAVNKVELWGTELNYKYRMHPHHKGGLCELMVGVRYMEFDETFSVEGLGGILDQSFWSTEAENHMIGPQLGLRWFRKQNRWTWSAEAKFFAAFNEQSVRQRSTLGSELVPPGGNTLTPGPAQGLPLAMGPSNATHFQHHSEWSPAAELRVTLKY